jgi:hypothetical protein
MATQNARKLNALEKTLPQGLLVDARWMEQHGYSTSLRSKYVAAGWLVQPARGTYKRPLGDLTWQKVVVSLQTLLESGLTVGGHTALDLQGFSHYLTANGPTAIHLYGQRPPPGWLTKLPLKETFRFHRAQILFESFQDPEQSVVSRHLPDLSDWSLVMSTPERALLELLDELPRHESFHQVDMLFEGLRTLSPRRLQTLLVACRSVKVKRLFLWFAERHNQTWLNQLDRDKIDLGTGKRMLVKGGKFDPKYLITVPSELDGPV